ncbi:hypothetical protein BIFDEN_00139 [Bifidobacterium dentium ATCC 27678]|uniref:Uncharacterized protein n=1 Tax=Bifidobacterium dentium (strain ATCC 27534 / DSM 20436 / JCM 1195 / Bd1) TaxID=401473 RepID=D2Q900_BIFDB|nr:hypothetical protein BDP_0620 [Bifidobacterium dentium Bd1]EDT44348.1 hypothetical protein BIFDEN_00139 [Bifidobacterium dentium ATCC 27678]BAQ26587.1 hypothetical protein BBDE_0593 [Bifidobacterium dentium JCM 1195 = DSM 20436]
MEGAKSAPPKLSFSCLGFMGPNHRQGCRHGVVFHGVVTSAPTVCIAHMVAARAHEGELCVSYAQLGSGYSPREYPGYGDFPCSPGNESLTGSVFMKSPPLARSMNLPNTEDTDSERVHVPSVPLKW